MPVRTANHGEAGVLSYDVNTPPVVFVVVPGGWLERSDSLICESGRPPFSPPSTRGVFRYLGFGHHAPSLYWSGLIRSWM